MIQLDRILVATDFSEHARMAFDYAVELARTFDAELLLCSVVEGPSLLSQVPPGGEAYFPPNLTDLLKQSAQETCEKLLQQAGLTKARILTPAGTPFVEIVRTARDENADLVVVGTHGRGAIAHALLGSVAEKVVRSAPCPVLTVRRGEHDFIHA
jgi:nucleotide-binding universal stress UspA family protein